MDKHLHIHGLGYGQKSSTSHHTQDLQGNDIPNVRRSSTSNATDRLSLLGGQTTQGNLTPTRMTQGHTGTVYASAFFKDGRRVVTGSADKTLRIWDVEKGALVGGPFEGHNGTVKSVAVSPDDRRIASGGGDSTIIIWDVESKQMVFDPLVKHEGIVWSVCISPDGRRLASGSTDRTVVLWDMGTGAVLSTLKGHQRRVWSVAFSPDGLKLASGSADGTIRVWRTDNAEFLLNINAHQDYVESVVWSPDSQRLVSASSNETVKFWNSSNGDQIGQPCTGHTSVINSLAISSDGSFIATASDDKTVRLWSTKTYQHVGQPLEHITSVYCVAISPNGELLASGDHVGNVRFWSIKEMVEQGKAEKRIKDYEEARLRLLLTLSDSQPQSHDTNNELSGKNNSSQSHQGSGGDKNRSLFDIPAVNTTVRNACIAGDLHTAEDLLTQEIDAHDNNYGSYAIRSVVRARNSQWDKALQDSAMSISIQPSLFGYVSKAIALCGNEQLLDAMEAFDLACIYSDRCPITVDLLLLIKAVALFNANHHDEARRRVQGLATAYQCSDTLSCRVVDLHLYVQLAIIAFEDRHYSEAADRLNECIPGLTDLFSCGAFFESRLKIFTVLFGWNLDSLWQTVNRIRCEAFLRADCVIDAVESHQYMMGMIDEKEKGSYLEWSTVFKQDCTMHCVTKGDAAVAASNYETAIELYSAAIALDPSCHSLFAHRSKAKLEAKQYAEALHDAERVVELNPSSYVGHELKYAALQGAQRNDEAVMAFKMMVSKLDDTPYAQMRKLRQHYVSLSEVEDTIRRIIRARLENTPLRELIPDPLPLSLFVDASTSFGIGFLADSRWLAWELLDGWRADGRDIGWAEMVAIDLGLRALVHSGLRDVHVRFHSDNQGVIGAFKAGRSRSLAHNDILRRLSSFAVDHDIWISLEWVKSAHNLADGISRGVFPTSCSRFSSPPPLPAYLTPFVRLV